MDTEPAAWRIMGYIHGKITPNGEKSDDIILFGQ
jgi:hypothetical protein